MKNCWVKKHVVLRAVYTCWQVPSRKIFPVFTLTSSVGGGGSGGREGTGAPFPESLANRKQRDFKKQNDLFHPTDAAHGFAAEDLTSVGTSALHRNVHHMPFSVSDQPVQGHQLTVKMI